MTDRMARAARRFVLICACAAAVAVWLGTHPSSVLEARAAEATERRDDAAASPGSRSPDADTTKVDKESSKDKAREEITIGRRGIVIDQDGKRMRIGGPDREYDSFEDFAKDAPWLAAFVFFVVSLVFLVPLLIIILLIWYKVRKNRMLNETMIKLAEKGVVPPADALQALGNNRVEATVTAGTATAPIYDLAKATRQRTAWSDLRKGILLGAVGLGLTLYSMFEDGSPSALGLIFLFVGAGFCVLWFFEDRDAMRRSGLPPGGGPPGGA